MNPGRTTDRARTSTHPRVPIAGVESQARDRGPQLYLCDRLIFGGAGALEFEVHFLKMRSQLRHYSCPQVFFPVRSDEFLKSGMVQALGSEDCAKLHVFG